MARNAAQRERLDNLLFALRDDELTQQQASELEQIVLGNADAMQHYLRVMNLGVGLRWMTEGGYDGCKMPSGGLPVQTSPPSDLPGSPPAPLLGFLGNTIHGSVGFFSSGWPVAYLMATVICGIGLLIGSLVHVSEPEQVAQQSVLPSTFGRGAGGEGSENVTHSRPVVGRITGMVECQFDQRSEISDPKTQGPRPKTLVSLGDTFALASGLMEITYDTGAKVILQGPATYEVESASGGFLSLGRLTARVEGSTKYGVRRTETANSGQWPVASDNHQSTINNQQSSNPQSLIPNPSSLSTNHYPLFTIKTPTAVVTDLGTEFGVTANKDGATEVQVFQGVVEAASSALAPNGERPKPIRLAQGEAVRVAARGQRIAKLPYRPETFVRGLRPTNGSDEFTLPWLSGMWTWSNHGFSRFSVTERPGWLRITLGSNCENAGKNARGGAPIMRTSATNYPANFSVETRIDAGTPNGGRFGNYFFLAALLVFDDAKDEETYPFDFTFGLGLIPGLSGKRVLVSLCDPSPDALMSDSLDWTSVYLRMDRDGLHKKWTLYYKHEAGDSWNRLGSIADDRLPGGGTGKMELGFIVRAGGSNLPHPKADFDYYRMTPLPAMQIGKVEP